jgi:flagellar hook-associated protein 1 FlgK
MSLNVMLSNAGSGLRAAQTGLKITSDNIANVDNSRYVRKVVDQQSAAYGGAGAGVEVAQIRRVADQFLQTASLDATSGASNASVMADLMDQVQGLFGLPTESHSISSQMQEMFTAFTKLAGSEPTLASRSSALNATSDFFDRAAQFAGGIRDIVGQAESRVRDDVARANLLMEGVAEYNRQISHGAASGSDVTGLQQRQSEMIDELSGLVDVQLQPTSYGGVVVRAFDGREIAGLDVSPLTVETVAGQQRLMVHTTGFPPHDVTNWSKGGSITGYLDFINNEAPAVTAQLTELTQQAANELNRVHNAHSPVPAPAKLEGRALTGTLDAALATQSGSTTIGLLDAAGQMTQKVDISFTGGTTGTVNGVAFTDAATFLTELNTAMAPASATFVAGRLTLDGGGSRLAVTSAPSPATAPGFSQTFGLNDLLVGEAPDLTIRPDILANPEGLSLAKADLSGAVGGPPVILKGDIRGADALGEAGKNAISFNAVGGAIGGSQSLNDYVVGFGSNIARQTDAAFSRKANNDAVLLEATARRANVEGVSMDEELIHLTTYQQAYNASARMMQAVSELYDVLLNLGR